MHLEGFLVCRANFLKIDGQGLEAFRTMIWLDGFDNYLILMYHMFISNDVNMTTFMEYPMKLVGLI